MPVKPIALKRWLLLWGLCSAVPGHELVAADEYFLKEITVTAYRFNNIPSVRSYANAVLYNSNGRIYNTQVILGHEVWDLASVQIYEKRVVTEIGLANNTTGRLGALDDHCYTARMAAHANAYNVHETDVSEVDCVPEPLESPKEEVEVPEENCPVLLDLSQDGLHLSGPDPAVSFDINADGIPDRIAWTSVGEDDAFLCLDRNGNGIIDDGTELFGYATPLLSGRRARVGYRALADLDRPELGGNADGKVEATDPLFHSLCAWVDTNRDAISQPQEIVSLDKTRVVALSYAYKTTQVTDTYGNLFRYVSSVDMLGQSGQIERWSSFDVIFAAGE
jgi:trimeric autotransporter adhesin